MYYVYILKSQKYSNKIYIGSTNSIINRLKLHNNGKCCYTQKYKPWSSVYYEAYLVEKLARFREHRLKNNGNALIELKKRIMLDNYNN